MFNFHIDRLNWVIRRTGYSYCFLVAIRKKKEVITKNEIKRVAHYRRDVAARECLSECVVARCSKELKNKSTIHLVIYVHMCRQMSSIIYI